MAKFKTQINVRPLDSFQRTVYLGDQMTDCLVWYA